MQQYWRIWNNWKLSWQQQKTFMGYYNKERSAIIGTDRFVCNAQQWRKITGTSMSDTTPPWCETYDALLMNHSHIHHKYWVSDHSYSLPLHFMSRLLEIQTVSLQLVTSSNPSVKEKNSMLAFWEGNVARRMLRAVMDISKQTLRKSLSDCPLTQIVPTRAKQACSAIKCWI